jgi:exopolysaccharide biosynthesis polyprenyl glycosylphosphotransferase
VANWSDVEFRKTPKYRRMQDVLSLAADILMLWDFLASVGCGVIASALWRPDFSSLDVAGVSHATLLPEMVIGSLVVAVALRSAVSVKRPLIALKKNLPNSAKRRFLFASAAFLAVAVAAQAGHHTAQTWILAWLLLFAPMLVITQLGLARCLTRLEETGILRESVAIVGGSGARERLAGRIASEAHVVGCYETTADYVGFLHQDQIEKLQELGAGGCVDSVVLAFEKEQAPSIAQIIEKLKVLPIQVATCQEGEWPKPAAADFRFLAGVPIKIVSKRPINRRDLLIKTVLDKIAAAMLLLILLPLMSFIAGVIALTSKGPFIFRQTRQGWCCQRFTVFKFRTMHNAPHAGDKYSQTKRNDPRCTSFGRFLRRTSLDELPQLWNVILGDMALVGPRPHADMLDDEDQAGREIVAQYAQRYRMKPGITGWAQIHGARGATSTVEQLRQRVTFDLYYIEHWSLWLDFKILIRTPFCMVGKNVF